MQTPNIAIPNIENTTDVATQLSFSPGHPVVLFPIRLETRFFTLADASSELRVRVYPDTVHIDSHEPDLTADEQTWGRHFWEETWRASTDEERAKSAWRQLADRFDPPRAAWVAKALRPLNPDERPEKPVPASTLLTTAPRFPTVATKAEAWTRAPFTRVLPNQWIVLGYKDGRLVVNARGNVIPDSLPTGPDPKVNEANPSDAAELGIDDGMKWMVDFAAAEEKGMGIRIKMSIESAAAGLDFLLVFGIKDSPGSTTDWTPRLAELFSAHHYTDGLSFVRQGTPSNNTADAPSGFSSADLGHEASYSAERAALAFQPGDRSNADVLTTALGLASAGQVFANLPNALSKEQLDAQQMNRALWEATWGYFLLQMLGVGETSESPLEDADIDWMRSHFIDHVRASGPLPALRVGKQPYGILPVTSLSAWKPPKGKESLYARDVVLRHLLDKLRDVWRRNYPNVPRLGRTDDIDQEKGIDKDLVEVLSMDARSSSYSVRNLMGRHYLEHLWVFLSAEYYIDVWEPQIDEPLPEPTPFELEEPPDDLRPKERIAWIREQQRLRLAAEREHQRWAAAMALRERRIAFIAAKRAATAAWWATQEQRTNTLLDSLGVIWKPRLARGVYAPPVIGLTGALVQVGPGSSLTPNYIESLLAARSLDDIRNEGIQPAPQPTLLYLLLRHSMLLEYVNAASRLLKLPPELRREPELVNISAAHPTQTVWDQLIKPISVAGEAVPKQAGAYLLGPTGEPDTAREPGLKPLSDFRASLGHLKSLDVSRLEELMTGTLDLSSHRLDAWITSFATKRLAEMRGANATGVLFGGYGWVTNLKPAAAQVQVPAPPGVQGPVFQLTNNPGFVHTPSLTQASTVAVLRSGHLAHAGNQMPNDLLSIDLSSERVRLASWLLDGVRQGQPLGALLGYRFERRLQEHRLQEGTLAKFISHFRELAPLVANKLAQTSQPAENLSVEAIAANNVVDGLRLHGLWQETQKDPPLASQKEQEFFSKLPAMTPDERAAVRLELMALNDSVDAVSDALMAETVYQVVRGNPLRVASTVEAIAGGEAPPPELEVVRTPRSGIALTHRLVTLFAGDPVPPTEWGPPGIPFRANAEPHLNAWAAKLLHNPTRVRCLVDRLEPGTGKVLESKELRLNQLRLAPLDFIYAVEGGEGGQQSEIEQRILYGIMRKADGFAPGSLLRVNPGRKAGWPATELGYGEFNELVRTARKLITGARAIDADDLDLPERTTEFSIDIAELEKRVTAAEVFLRRTPNDFKTLLAAPNTASLDSLRDLIIRSAGYGVAGAVPLSAAGASPSDRQTLIAQAISIQKELTQRVEQLTVLVSGFNSSTATVEARRDHALARLRIVFGKQFIVLPRFTAANAEELEKALADSTKILDGDPFVSTTWFKRMARVRDGVSRLNATLNYSEALKTGEKLKLNIAQLPHSTDDRWVGLPLKPGKSLPGGKLSIAVQSSAPLDVRKPLAGLLIDEWVEVVPSETETTGIALQYDRPNAAPPQTILIAVPPELEVPWTVWSLQQVLLETLDLARVRAVDPDALNEVGHYLPALYFALNTAGDTVSTDFNKVRS
jgi:hypothetical protein